jgi:TusA-related sulfurtransferase
MNSAGENSQNKAKRMSNFLRRKGNDSSTNAPSTIEISLRIRLNESFGIALSQTPNGVCIGGIDGAGQFANSPLKVGMRLLTINDQPCPASLSSASQMIHQLPVGSLLKIQAMVPKRKSRIFHRSAKQSHESDTDSNCSEETTPLPSILKKEYKYTKQETQGCPCPAMTYRNIVVPDDDDGDDGGDGGGGIFGLGDLCSYYTRRK